MRGREGGVRKFLAGSTIETYVRHMVWEVTCGNGGSPLTNAFSKKVENFSHAAALHYMHYNFARPHSTLTNAYPRPPAMATGVADHIWTLQEIVALLD